jgi:DNA-binding NtrC family response regulator
MYLPAQEPRLSQWRVHLTRGFDFAAAKASGMRERAEDISLLADYFVAKAGRKCRMRPRPISARARDCLLSYDWPGNVRELEHAMERAPVMGAADQILLEDLPAEIFEAASVPAEPASPANYHVVKEQKKQVVLKAMQQCNGNYIEAAKAMGRHPNSLAAADQESRPEGKCVLSVAE